MAEVGKSSSTPYSAEQGGALPHDVLGATRSSIRCRTAVHNLAGGISHRRTVQPRAHSLRLKSPQRKWCAYQLRSAVNIITISKPAFQSMSDTIVGRIDDMTNRVDELERNVQELANKTSSNDLSVDDR
ncbi:hypothetical protein FOZ60_004159 [Perkinsus olseni]|uniref:Heat shock factor-binding protein 1 n=1 Tax=Perkinsus olseni TaxID=32597 RepID=A0A7J6NUQ1_PEROL|nr:hypothetical protein FOZ60_004159 [Perkinsus olseni]